MTRYGNAVSALNARLLVIGAVGLAGGVIAFALGYSATPRVDVIGYVDIARVVRVDADGKVSGEPAVSPIVLAGQVNSGAFFDTAGDGAVRRARVIARVPPRADNIELSARVESAEEGIRIITEVVRRMNAAHRARQQGTLERLQQRQEALQAEIEELVKTRRQLDRLSAEVASKPRNGLQYFLLVSLRAQSSREIRELERERETIADAVRQMQERQTRLVGDVLEKRASALVPLAIGIVGAIFTALLASAVVFALAYRQAVRGA